MSEAGYLPETFGSKAPRLRRAESACFSYMRGALYSRAACCAIIRSPDGTFLRFAEGMFKGTEREGEVDNLDALMTLEYSCPQD